MIEWFEWDSNDLIWNETNINWENAYLVTGEIISTIKTSTGGKGQQYLKNVKNIHHVEKKDKKIKLICIIDDEKFSKTNYINKKIKLNSSNEIIIIDDIVKIEVNQKL